MGPAPTITTPSPSDSCLVKSDANMKNSCAEFHKKPLTLLFIYMNLIDEILSLLPKRHLTMLMPVFPPSVNNFKIPWMFAT